jgi:hypothetical protein
MGKKNKSGGLIEDRIIRQPMEQMRRKLKFKAKKERKELKVFAKSLKEEHKPLQDSKNTHFSLKMLNNNEDEETG